MARTRMIKPEFWSDEKLAKLSLQARLTYIGLWNLSDDYGVVKGHPAWLKNSIYPYDDLRIGQFETWLAELERIGRVVPFVAGGEKFYAIRNCRRHQTINRPSQIRNPDPPLSLMEDSLSTHGALTDETETETETEVKQKQKGGCGGKTKILTSPLQERFDSFWHAYPRKRSKGQAERAFLKISPDEQLLATMIATIERATTSADWLREEGRFIPHPATWLNARGWEDEENNRPHHVSGTTIGNMKIMEEWRPPYDEHQTIPGNDDDPG